MNKHEKNELFQNINYMNFSELKTTCDKYKIPYKIHIEVSKNKLKKINDMDRKGIIIKRIKHFVSTGKTQKPTIFPNKVISTFKLPSPLQSSHLILYGEYKNGDKNILYLLKSLTDNQFKFGAIAQEVLRECWSKGEAPSYAKFAKLWLKANKLHTKPNPEWAFLADKNKGFEGDWKKLRIEKAKKALTLLNSLVFSDKN